MRKARFAGMTAGCDNVCTAVMLSPVNYKRDICETLLKSVAASSHGPPNSKAILHMGVVLWIEEKHESPR